MIERHEKEEAVLKELAAATGSTLVQQVGHTAVYHLGAVTKE